MIDSLSQGLRIANPVLLFYYKSYVVLITKMIWLLVRTVYAKWIVQNQTQSNFIIECDKRTQNSAEFSENDSAEKHNKNI